MVADGVLSRENVHAYASRIIEGPEGAPVLLSWLSRMPGNDEFAGVLSNPKPLRFDNDGTPHIELQQDGGL